eukprot:8905920-Karenia_brevis.AAC.1
MKKNWYEGDPFPKLRGRATEIRNLGFPLEYAFIRFSDTDNEIHKKIKLALKMNNEIERIVKRNRLTIKYSQSEYK